MVPHVLGVGYAYNEYEVTAGRWKEFEIEFDYADNIKQAAAMLSFKEYICVAICSDVIPQDDLDILRQKRAVPIIVVPPSYSEEQRYACVHFGAAQYLHTYNHPMVEMFSEKNSMRNCLKIPKDKRRPLTIITVKDLSFCLEYRSVEIAGVCIDLTEKEFDILALLWAFRSISQNAPTGQNRWKRMRLTARPGTPEHGKKNWSTEMSSKVVMR